MPGRSIAVVSDDRVTAEAVAIACRQDGDDVTIRDAVSGGRVDADVVVLDLTHPADGYEPPITTAAPTRTIVLAAPDRCLPQGLRITARLAPDTSLDQLLAAITIDDDAASTVTAGQPAPAHTGPLGDLTPREQQVLAALTTGAGTRAIGEQLAISEHTVRTHLNNVLSKLGVSSRAEAVAVALRDAATSATLQQARA